MTFGKQNTIQEGVEQLKLAYEQYGINFLDTGESFPFQKKKKEICIHPTNQSIAHPHNSYLFGLILIGC